ncbi:CotH kinase family protein [Myxococcota bacterium]
MGARCLPLPFAWACTLCACGLPQAEQDIDYSAIFVSDRLVEWKISVDNEAWHQLRVHPAVYVPADLEVDGIIYDDVGLRMIGNRNRPKVGMRIRFNEFNPTLRYHGVKRLSLSANAGDPTLVRQSLALRLMRDAGVPAPRSSFVWVDWGNGGGIYTLEEQVDRKLLEDRFDEADGNLYKVDMGGNLVFRGDDPASYDWTTTYGLKTNELHADHSGLIELMKVLARVSVSDLDQILPEVLDVEAFLRLLAVNSWLANMESYAGTAAGFYLYHDSTGRFRMIPRTPNRAFGNFHGRHCTHAECDAVCTESIADHCAGLCDDDKSVGGCVEDCAESFVEHYGDFQAQNICLADQPEYCEYPTDDLRALDPDNPTCSPDRPLVHEILKVPAFKERYHELLGTLMDGPLSPREVRARMDAMRALVSTRVHEDAWKDYAYDEAGVPMDFDTTFSADTVLDLQDPWEYRVPGLMPFVLDRDALIRENLGGL